MADFVAVIRRAVDGLTNNTPEMRDRVYDKARGAVRRQLESMKPQPPEELVRRQLDKLEKAITDVEGEHAEALPEEAVPAEEAQSHGEPEPVDAAETDALPAESETPAAHGETEADAPSAEVREDAEPYAADRHDEPVQEEAPEPTADEPVADHDPHTGSWPDERLPEPVDVPVSGERADEVASGAESAWQQPAWDIPPAADDTPDEHAASVEDGHQPDWVPHSMEEQPVRPVADDAAEPLPNVLPFSRIDEVGDHTHAPLIDEHAAVYPEMRSDGDAPVSGDAIDPATLAPIDEPVARMPSAEADLNWDKRNAAKDQSHGAAAAPTEWTWTDERTAAAAAKKPEPSAWDDLEDLIGYDRNADNVSPFGEPSTTPDVVAALPAAEETARSVPDRSFAAVPRRRGPSGKVIAAVFALLVLVGGAAAGYWFNRETVDGFVADLVATVEVPSSTTTTTPEAGETSDSAQQTPAAETSDETPQTEIAAADSTSTKFTQRLLADGTETDEGAAPALGDAVPVEGKSVAEQTAGAALATPGDTATDTGTQGAVGTTADTDVATPGVAAEGQATGDAPIGVAQKMFLYEERLGQTGPTAIEGSVVWSQAEEAPGGDGKPEPVIRAQVTVPSRNLTALMTIRRNGDRSLPASHLLELVFSLPQNFEGGSIDSVQRVAMKQNEQDRGDALIAVPAKITEDFHMIALNDFSEAIGKNLELLRTREWIDIPLTYRNGRRALITLDKGATGAKVFDDTLKAWAALGPSTNNSQ
ncbi:hypothetical protein LXM94_00125 [Rhizobium sp. TRM95111]|uniref:hypothetical protein n=1 Tax=Rhizobium alarense TaxID=2846851 RepID=UPI001F3676DC|nr:hypothetical protein [Rhizobium alarense]MCF3638375.1 hypothetical protein [Rhizobium alarense]